MKKVRKRRNLSRLVFRCLVVLLIVSVISGVVQGVVSRTEADGTETSLFMKLFQTNWKEECSSDGTSNSGAAAEDMKEGNGPEGAGTSGQEDVAKNNAVIAAFAQEQGLSTSIWPGELVDLLERNPDAEEFVLHYPLNKEKTFEIDLTDQEQSDTVPLFFQWDERWGYTQYGDNVMGLTGCGPTCLSMVCVYLLNDGKYHPRYIADFAEENGYCVPGSGSAWTLISEGGETLGLDVTEIPLDEDRIVRNLKVGNPVICIMGPGDFTTTGHFIVLTRYEDGKFSVNDPNSKVRSEKLWSYEEIKGQIKNLWVCRK